MGLISSTRARTTLCSDLRMVSKHAGSKSQNKDWIRVQNKVSNTYWVAGFSHRPLGVIGLAHGEDGVPVVSP